MSKPHQYDYPRPALTADIVIFRTTAHGTPEILLIKRKHEPFANHWALPGGFCDEGETCHQAAIRELAEETGCKSDSLTAVGVFDTPGRDPRGWTVSMAYMGNVPEGTNAIAGDDAKETRWVLIDGLPEKLAFDHEKIIRAAVQMQNTANVLEEAKLALQANGVFYTPLELRLHGNAWNEFQKDAMDRTRAVLGKLGHS